MGTEQALSGTDKKSHRQENKKQLGSAVTGTAVGIARNATCVGITVRMGRFVTCSALA